MPYYSNLITKTMTKVPARINFCFISLLFQKLGRCSCNFSIALRSLKVYNSSVIHRGLLDSLFKIGKYTTTASEESYFFEPGSTACSPRAGAACGCAAAALRGHGYRSKSASARYSYSRRHAAPAHGDAFLG